MANFKILPRENGTFGVFDVERNEFIFPDRAFPNPQIARDALEELASQKGWDVSVSYTPERKVKRTDLLPQPLQLEMTVTKEFGDLLTALAARMNKTRGEAIHKGLVLLQIALDVKDEGKRLVAIDDKTNVEEEIQEV